ncbi:HAMP domain-containing sensor histidine kinase [Neglectibacter caecimuris]|uniref:HAMP domain-containing sensor histidine kinase n=1 Tax=Neglectibacter caecimuris TaxID=3093658 RepID=UPI002AC9902D|nr:HAMP domain-containing sensor histidine kinase [Neglectibacter sp. M00184]
MKNRVFFGGLLVLFLMELVLLFLFALPRAEKPQDAVEVNEAVKTVQRDWGSLENHKNSTALDYVAVDSDGTVLYRTKQGLSESVNAAISHKDTILPVEVEGKAVGKLFVYNRDAQSLQVEKQTVIFAVIAVSLGQCALCALYFFYLHRRVIRPFSQLKDFAQRVAQGNLEIPLQMDRQNLFGAFTESFDLMRSELKKAKLAEAKAQESKRELVAKLSHDIKTPVASIKAASEVGAALASQKKIKANYRQIVQKADQINTLVTNLFSAALEELQELSVTPAELSSEELRTLLENADYLHRGAIPPIPDCVLFADKLRLQQVFDNLFANSYKYADTQITVTAGLEDRCLAVRIEDRGGGVEEAELPLLKEKFKRGGNAKNIEGAGLGLYIADTCMKKMRGELELENGQAGLRATVRIALSSAI